MDNTSPSLTEAFEHFEKERFSQAQAICKMILKQDPKNCEALNLLASCFLKKEKYEKAVKQQEETIAIEPENIEYLKNLELMYRKNEQFEQAIEVSKKALKIDPNLAQYHYCAGLSLCHLWQLDEAIKEFNKTIELDQYYLKAHVMLGNSYQEIGLYEEARKHFDIALEMEPNNPYVTYNRSLLLMILGEFKEGLRDYEDRWQQGVPMVLPNFVKGKEVWDGKELADKSLLIMVEQGFGDIIQFSRYLKQVIKMGDKINVFCHSGPIFELIKPLAPDANWLTEEDTVPEFDYYLTLMSFPYIFGDSVETIPADIPYIFASEEKKSEWKNKIKDTGKKKIALCWSGSARHPKDHIRSIKPEQIEILFTNKDFDFYILQKGRDEDEAKNFADKYENVFELGSQIKTFSDSAGIIDAMDMVVTVDTALAHLGGAMGKPVWNMLLFNADWRWLLDRDDSPWYPTMRLFRQSTRNDWGEVLQRISAELTKLEN
jgi:Tfp pilus assembly protein PilF